VVPSPMSFMDRESVSAAAPPAGGNPWEEGGVPARPARETATLGSDLSKTGSARTASASGGGGRSRDSRRIAASTEADGRLTTSWRTSRGRAAPREEG